MENSLKNATESMGQSTYPRNSARFDWLFERMTGPGGYYNVGNVIALAGGAMIHVVQSPAGLSPQGAIVTFLVGNPGATWLSISMFVFILAGELYHRAYAEFGPPNGKLLRLADASAGVAGLAIMISLMHFGDVVMAVIAGTMLAGGKFGTAILPREAGNGPITWPRLEATLRWSVVLSRFPSLAALTLEILRVFLRDDPAHLMAMPALMAFCFLLWLRADLLLMKISDNEEAGTAS